MTEPGDSRGQHNPGASPRRVAVPVLVKDGKPMASSGSEDEGQHNGGGMSGIGSSGGHGGSVKSEYTLPESSSVGDLLGPGSMVGHPGDTSQSLPPLMHMGYAVSRHAGVGHQGLLQQAGMCSYGQHKTGW